jgi:hypothetical protein
MVRSQLSENCIVNTLGSSLLRHSREGGNPSAVWIAAFAGMTVSEMMFFLDYPILNPIDRPIS